ncbi:hypothetical protein CHUAL_005035 [Chamberlinius hualienensis]
MNTQNHLAALILARGGSRGIPRKNIKDLNGIPLIGWTLRAAEHANCFQSIWVSTEDEEIAYICQKYSCSVHHRSSEYSGDNVSSIAAVKEFLSHHKEITHVGLLQCTSPCVQPLFLSQAANLLLAADYDSVFAANRKFHLRWTSSQFDDGVTPLNFDPKKRPQRQAWAGELVECGMFYFATTELIVDQNALQGGKCGVVEIPEEYSLDIDTPYDWLIAEAVVPKYGYKGEI